MHPSAPFAEFVSFFMRFYRWLVRKWCEILGNYCWLVRKLCEILDNYSWLVRKLLVRQGRGFLENWLHVVPRGPSWPLVASRGPTWPLVPPRGPSRPIVALGALKSNSLQVFIDLWFRFEIRDRIAVDRFQTQSRRVNQPRGQNESQPRQSTREPASLRVDL